MDAKIRAAIERAGDQIGDAVAIDVAGRGGAEAEVLHEGEGASESALSLRDFLGVFHRPIGIEKKDINRAEVGERITLVSTVIIERRPDHQIDDAVAIQIAERAETLA